MKSLILFVAVAAALAAAEPAKEKKQPAAVSASRPASIPKEAVPSADGKTYTYTDHAGKKWIYRNSPFGFVKTAAPEDKPAASPAAAELKGTKVIDKGDSVRFERPSPFGKVVWEKKKTELTDSERQLIDEQKAPQN